MIELVSHCSKTKSVSCENSKMSFLVLHKNRFYTYSKKSAKLFSHTRKIRKSVMFINMSYQELLNHEISFATSKVNEP